MIPQTGRRLEGSGPLEGGQAAAGQPARLLELTPPIDGPEGAVDQPGGHAASTQLGAQAGGTIPAGGAAGDPLAGERRVVEMATALEVGDDVGGDLRWRTATPEAGREVGPRPRAARQQVTRGETGSLEVEDPSRRSNGPTTSAWPVAATRARRAP